MTGRFCWSYLILIIVVFLAFVFGAVANRYKIRQV